jgi:hypothetical protein
MSSQDKAHEAIGAYLCVFSTLERELGETVKVIFGLQQHEAADIIVAALHDFSRKVRLIQGAIAVAKKADGSETSSEWKDASEKTLDRTWSANDDRVLLAHSLLEPNDDGSLKLTRLQLGSGAASKTWTEKDFERKVNEIRDLIRQLQSIRTDLSNLTITVPSGWLTIDQFQSQPPRLSPEALRAIVEPASNWVPRPPE